MYSCYYFFEAVHRFIGKIGNKKQGISNPAENNHEKYAAIITPYYTQVAL